MSSVILGKSACPNSFVPCGFLLTMHRRRGSHDGSGFSAFWRRSYAVARCQGLGRRRRGSRLREGAARAPDNESIEAVEGVVGEHLNPGGGLPVDEICSAMVAKLVEGYDAAKVSQLGAHASPKEVCPDERVSCLVSARIGHRGAPFCSRQSSAYRTYR